MSNFGILIEMGIQEKIVGYTQSGKPVYCPVRQNEIEEFSSQDHLDALRIFLDLTKAVDHKKDPNWKLKTSFFDVQYYTHDEMLSQLLDESWAELLRKPS